MLQIWVNILMARFRRGFGLGALDKIETRSGQDPDEIQTKSEKSFVQTLPAGGQEETGQERRDNGTIPAPVRVLCSTCSLQRLL